MPKIEMKNLREWIARLSGTYGNTLESEYYTKYGKEYLGFYRQKKDENAQDAHEAIRPTNVENTPDKVKKYIIQP